MNYITKDQIQWQDTKIIKINADGPADIHPYLYKFQLPWPLSQWDVFDYWEKERLVSMAAHLKLGDVLFDVGTEQGWCNLIYAQFVGAENMVLIEPTPDFWPNIKATWEKNYDVQPRGFYDGLFSNVTNEIREGATNFTHWPYASDGDLIDRNRYQYIHDNPSQTSEIELDEYVRRSGIIPQAITIDTEGSELLVLQGARKTLEQHHPKLWVSIHPELSERDYKVSKEDVMVFMKLMGYTGELLAIDHEEHFYFASK